VGGPSQDAVVGAGFALAGAAATRAIDVAHDRKRDAAEADASRRRDLDETQRLLYMALVLGRASTSSTSVVSWVMWGSAGRDLWGHWLG
jgi:hypothetical protein